MAAMDEIWSGGYRYLLSLYWLAFLLTECEELSIRIVVEAFGAREDPCSLRRESKQIRNALIGNALSETRSADQASYVERIVSKEFRSRWRTSAGTVLETRTTALIAFTGSFTRKSHAL